VTEHTSQSSALPKGAATPRVLRLAIIFIASGAGAGYTPVFPGTVGSLLGLLVVRYGLEPVWNSPSFLCLLVFAATFIGACVVARYAERMLAEPDSPLIVVDEVLGMIATMLGNQPSWPWLIAGFTVFRLFDIIKPWPASWFDQVQGGSGIMLDDLAAACYANITLKILQRLM
jgi:phosphatidylglycerophosphatase A